MHHTKLLRHIGFGPATGSAGCIPAAALAAIIALSHPAMGQSLGGPVAEVRFGVLSHDVPGLWSGFNREGSRIALNGEVLFRPHLTILGGTLRPALGGTIATGGGTSKAYLDARWEIESRSGLFLALGLGAAVHNGNLAPTDPNRKSLGSRLLYHIPLEIGWRWDGRQSVSVYFDHISNGYSRRFNEGLDTLGLRYGYRF